MKKEMFVLMVAVIFLGGNPAFSQTSVQWDDSFLIATVDPGSEEDASVFYETLDMPEQREMYGYSKLFITLGRKPQPFKAGDEALPFEVK